jgi:Ulp1 family protease
MPTEDDGCDKKNLQPSPTGVRDEEIRSDNKGGGASNKHSLKVKSKNAEARGPTLVDHLAEERKISSHALADGGHDKKNLKPPPAVQDDDISKKKRRAANSQSLKGRRSERAEPRGQPLVDSSAEYKIIRHALADGHDDDVIAQVGSSGHKVTRQAMQSLKPGQWLMDEVVNAFFYLLSHREEDFSRNDATRKRNGFFNSFFMTKLLNEGHSSHSGEYEYNNIRNLVNKVCSGRRCFRS